MISFYRDTVHPVTLQKKRAAWIHEGNRYRVLFEDGRVFREEEVRRAESNKVREKYRMERKVEPMISFSISLSRNTLNKLQGMAEENHVSRVQLIRQLIKEALEK